MKKLYDVATPKAYKIYQQECPGPQRIYKPGNSPRDKAGRRKLILKYWREGILTQKKIGEIVSLSEKQVHRIIWAPLGKNKPAESAEQVVK